MPPAAPDGAMTKVAIGDPRAASRTQGQRRAETRAKLLDATIASILEVGYAQTTTRRVSELAGVSAGAQAYHFPRRVELVAAAIEHLANTLVEDGSRRAATLPDAFDERLPAMLDLVWAEVSSPSFTVFVKLWVAAADDPELYRQLVVAERQIARAITRVLLANSGELGARPDIEQLLLLVMSACRGLALTERLEPRSHRRRDRWPVLRLALLDALQAPRPAAA